MIKQALGGWPTSPCMFARRAMAPWHHCPNLWARVPPDSIEVPYAERMRAEFGDQNIVHARNSECSWVACCAQHGQQSWLIVDAVANAAAAAAAGAAAAAAVGCACCWALLFRRDVGFGGKNG